MASPDHNCRVKPFPGYNSMPVAWEFYRKIPSEGSQISRFCLTLPITRKDIAGFAFRVYIYCEILWRKSENSSEKHAKRSNRRPP